MHKDFATNNATWSEKDLQAFLNSFGLNSTDKPDAKLPCIANVSQESNSSNSLQFVSCGQQDMQEMSFDELLTKVSERRH